jgi:hypothetical protein
MANDDELIKPRQSAVLDRNEQLLNNLALIARVIQRQANPPNEDRNKSFWNVFREPVVMAALITVSIGGLAVAYFQWRAGVREKQLAAYTEYLGQEQGLIKRAYGLIGACTSEGDNLTGLMQSDSDERARGQATVEYRNQRLEIIKRFNTTKRQWHSEKGEIGLLMSYYHPGEGQVMANWNNVEKAVTEYLKCKQGWFNDYNNGKIPPSLSIEQIMTKCEPKYDDLMARLGDLSSSLEKSRRYAWT